MAGKYRFEMDQKEMARSLTTTIGSFIQDRLIDKEQRTQHKEQCAERLAADVGNSNEGTEVRYSDQALLANLDWGIDALEEAIDTPNTETKMARLEHAEKMLQLCAMLNSSKRTAGVPNFYLSAWAHLNLSYLWKLRNNVHNAVLHILEMFIIDPFFSRIDFAPELWKSMFLPHMSSIVGWYLEERRRIMIDVIPDSSDLSFTVDFGNYFDESLIQSVRPEQAEKIKKLEQLYGQSLDDNTRLYAKYYKDCLMHDTAISQKVIPMLPIAEPPMTPLHEVSHSVPDYVKFGPILPKNAGFSPVLEVKENAQGPSRLKVTSTLSKNMEDFTTLVAQEEVPEQSEESGDHLDGYFKCNNRALEFSHSSGVKLDKKHEVTSPLYKEEKVASATKVVEAMSRQDSPSNSFHMDSPRTTKIESPSAGTNPRNRLISVKLVETKSRIDSSPNSFLMDSPETTLSPRAGKNSRNRQTSVLRLLSTRATGSKISASLPGSPDSCSDQSSISAADSDGEMAGHQETARSISVAGSVRQLFPKRSLCDADRVTESYASSPLSEMRTPQSRPPKDFVCPITSQIFNDPVTLETGQTYERKAIQEWMNRGNATCPITRQPLSATLLPKTNYVLKRLITSWKEQHPDLAQEFSSAETPRSYIRNSSPNDTLSEPMLSARSTPSTQRIINNETEHKPRRFTRAALVASPTSVISQVAVETVINTLKPYILCLCNSEDLKECEEAVLIIARTWDESTVDPGIHSYLSSPTIVNGFVEILSASLNRDVLRTTIYILSRLLHADDSVGKLLTNMDHDFCCLTALLKKGLEEAAILMYMLRPSFCQLSEQSLIQTLIQIIANKNEDPTDFHFPIAPKDAAIGLLEQIISRGDEREKSVNAGHVISAHGIPALLSCLNRVDARHSIIPILLCCIHVDATCRNMIANTIELSPVLELFHDGDDSTRGSCIEFLSELVQLSRRTLCNQILQIIKDEGAFSTMHALLVYLQMCPIEQKPALATLLFQLDLLVHPRKMSIYREEAVDVMLEALQRKDFPSSQIMVLDALSSLSGHFSAYGKSSLECWLLKIAGFDRPYRDLVKGEEQKSTRVEFTETRKEEEKAARSWEKRVVLVLLNHEKGMILRVLEDCFKSNSIEIARSCLVVGTWLVHMLYSLPDFGIRNVARKCWLDKFVNVLQSSKNQEEKILAALALRGFITEQEGLDEVGLYAKSMWKVLRKLKKFSTAANDILKALINLPSVDPAELWSCVECPELDVCMNGEVLSMLHIRNRLISSHSDGTIKVWDVEKRVPRLIQEVHEHSKAVTCLYVPPSCEKLYSGSLDKTIRVWSMKQEEIYCVQVHDVKDAVYELTANTKFACFSSQGTGVKVYNWSDIPKHVNFNRNVKSLALRGDKLYCGCSGYSIQEVDLRTHTSTTFYSGIKKLLGKQTISSLQIDNGLLFAGGSSIDGVAGKVFSISTKAVIESLSTGFDIQKMSVNSDFIFAATKCGIIEVWLKERLIRIASIKTGSSGNGKVASLASDDQGQKLFAGSSDGKIQAWSLD